MPNVQPSSFTEEKLMALRKFVEEKAMANDFTGLTALEAGFMEGYLRRTKLAR